MVIAVSLLHAGNAMDEILIIHGNKTSQGGTEKIKEEGHHD